MIANARTPVARLTTAVAPALWIAALLVLAGQPDTAEAQDQLVQGQSWRADLRVDLELAAFEDPTLLRVLTEQPDNRKRLRGSQPFKQQPLFAQQDFRPPLEPTAACVPGPGVSCR